MVYNAIHGRPVGNSCKIKNNYSPVQFGSVLYDGKEIKMKKGVVDSTSTLPSKVVFKGSNFLEQEMKLKWIILIGTMHVEVEYSPT